MERRDFLAKVFYAASGLAELPKFDYQAISTAAKNQTSKPNPVEYFTSESPDYERARQTANAGISLRPSVIACCTAEKGIVDAVLYAAERDLPLTVKSGGHSFEGFCLNDGGMVVDVSRMEHATLEPNGFVLVAGPGCTLKKINDYLLPRGRLLPTGSCGSVGLSGLTLGGGYGFFARHFGLTCDHLLAVRLVDGHGNIRDSRDEPELLWACRGGGNGHFGVVTELRYRTQPAPRQLSAYRFRAHKLRPESMYSLAEKWFEAAAELPMEAFSALVLSGHSIFILVVTHGEPEDKNLLEKLKKIAAFMSQAEPLQIRPLKKAMPQFYAEMHPTFFKNGSAGFYNGFDDIRPAMPKLIEILGSQSGILFQVNTMGGAIAGGEPSAYAHRKFLFLGEVQSQWEKPAQASSRIEAVKRIHDLLTDIGIRNHYVNYPDKEIKDWPAAYYGRENYGRLQKLKKELDPKNLFQYAQSVRCDAGS